VAYNWAHPSQVCAYLLAQKEERQELLSKVRQQVMDHNTLPVFLITHPLIPQGILVDPSTNDQMLCHTLQTM
jgi:hypothetical protein